MKVTLVCGKQKLPVSYRQAEDILRGQNHGNKTEWELEKDSPYEFINNGLRKKRNTGADSKKTECKEVTKGNSS